MLERIDQLQQQAAQDLAAVTTADQLEQFRIKYLGTKGALKDLLAMLKQIPPADKPAFGQRANELRREIQQRFEARKLELGGAHPQSKGPRIDVTEPGTPPRLGRSHVITQTIDELLEVFGRMGFDVATGPELEDEFHNFVALNIPPQHPARDPLDNFFLRDPAGKRAGAGQGGDQPSMLRSQTSTIQIRVMEKQPPPVRVVAVGRVYRPDEHDATHYSMFHQIEGLYVDRGVDMADLKTTLLQFARVYFGPETQVRLRPSFFPFTEPSAEMEVRIDLGQGPRWMELGGCGMVDPNVFKAVGYDAEEWTGWAFGLGIERIAMRKYGIADIRWLFENDLRFLRQF